MSELPPFSLSRATAISDRVAALQLVSNSIAQQRQTLNRRITRHPYFLTPLLALFAVVAKLNYRTPADLATLAILLAGATIALLSVCSRYTSDYLTHAETVGSEEGLRAHVNGEERDVVVARWGERVIGTAMIKFRGERTVLWAWTVELRYRGKGLGRDLLVEAVRVARERNGPECVVELAEDHANSFRIAGMPETFNEPFNQSESRTKKLLKKLCETE